MDPRPDGGNRPDGAIRLGPPLAHRLLYPVTQSAVAKRVAELNQDQASLTWSPRGRVVIVSAQELITPMHTEGSGATRAGDDDFVNEDAYLVEEGLGLYVVCDGSGERPAGEIASTVAIEALEDFVASNERFRELARGEPLPQTLATALSATHSARCCERTRAIPRSQAWQRR